ncbi:MAG: glycoside hydrolase family 31 protein [Opitutaceae bacterium]|nr:glycoside hydrolase family 31 protein [Opitutaceae bacterium]
MRILITVLASLLLTPIGATQVSPPANPVWTQVAPGVWKSTIGQPEDLTLLSAAGGKPAASGLAAMPAAVFPLESGEIEGRQVNANTTIRFPLAAGEDIYGLGVDFANLRRNGAIFELHVDHWSSSQKITGRTHAPVPLYVSTRGFAVLFDSARYLKVTVGHGVRLAAKQRPPIIDRTTKKVWHPGSGSGPDTMNWQSQPRSDSIEVLARATGIDVYVFAGPTPMDAVRRYNLFCGGGALPPKWGLGFLNRVRTQYTAAEVLADIAEFRANRIPLDMIGLEPGWMDHAYPCSFEWDKTRFPEPKAFLAEVEKQHVRLNLWFNPYVGPPATPLYPKLLPYAGTHLVWNGIVPDYSMAQAREIFAAHLRQTVLTANPAAIGGFKLDEVDGYDRYLWPDTAVFPSGHDSEQLRQTYGLLLQHVVFDVFHQANRRTMGQIRGTNAGASPYPFVIYNDNYNFDEYITAVSNSGFAGVLWSPEVRGSNNGEDMLRRTQAVCFSPLALYNGWASSQKLWTHEAVKDHIRAAIQLRLRLLPYFYQAFAQYHHQGTPVIRPMPLAMGVRASVDSEPGRLDATSNPYEVPRAARETKDQYFFGDSLLVAPIAPGAQSRRVLLPPGKWYDFHSGKFAGENETIEVAPSLSELPVFVKDGALIPMLADERQYAPRPGERVGLEVRHYGDAPGRVSLYDDDGETFDYERGEYSWTELITRKDAAGKWSGAIVPDANGKRWSYGEVSWRFMSQR